MDDLISLLKGLWIISKLCSNIRKYSLQSAHGLGVNLDYAWNITMKSFYFTLGEAVGSHVNVDIRTMNASCGKFAWIWVEMIWVTISLVNYSFGTMVPRLICELPHVWRVTENMVMSQDISLWIYWKVKLWCRKRNKFNTMIPLI